MLLLTGLEHSLADPLHIGSHLILVFNLEPSYVVGNFTRGMLDRKDLLIRRCKSNQLRSVAKLFLEPIDDDLLSLLGRLLGEELGGLVDHPENLRHQVYCRLIGWDYNALRLIFKPVLLQYRHLVLENCLVVLVQ